jgi:hypothetical protein
MLIILFGNTCIVLSIELESSDNAYYTMGDEVLGNHGAAVLGNHYVAVVIFSCMT